MLLIPRASLQPSALASVGGQLSRRNACGIPLGTLLVFGHPLCPCREVLRVLLVCCVSVGGSLSKRAPSAVKRVVMPELGMEPSC